MSETESADTERRPHDLQPFIDQADLAVAALREIADARQIGAFLRAEAEADPDACTLRFASDVPGYPHWEWVAVLGRADASSIPTVLEVGLMPGEGALVPPAWVPWSERFAEYQAARAESADEESTDDAETATEGEASPEAAGETAVESSETVEDVVE